jgi:hypothetical protein
MAFQIVRNETLIAVCNSVAGLIGYPTTKDAVGSQDPKMQQIVATINMASKDLLTMATWQEMVREAQIVVVADFPGQTEKEYDLPEDYYQFIDQTQNNLTTKLPTRNPMAAVQWQTIKALMPAATVHTMWRVKGNKMCFLYPPSTPETIQFEYVSCAYVQDADDATLYKNIADKNADVFLLDPDLIMQLSRARWLEVNGFDSGAAMRDFQRLYDNRIGGPQGAPVLNMSNSGAGSVLINIGNVPQTGYGL